MENQPGKRFIECPLSASIWKREHDLVEEIGRLFGIDKIPSTPPAVA